MPEWTAVNRASSRCQAVKLCSSCSSVPSLACCSSSAHSRLAEYAWAYRSLSAGSSLRSSANSRNTIRIITATAPR